VTSKSNRTKYYGVCDSPAQNGKQYDFAIDDAIINELFISTSLSSGDLKGKLEKKLGRDIFPKTYYNHINMMIEDNLLKRIDLGKRGIKSVYYSLTEAAKKKQKLMLMPPRTGEIHRTSYFSIIKEIYAHIFSRT